MLQCCDGHGGCLVLLNLLFAVCSLWFVECGSWSPIYRLCSVVFMREDGGECFDLLCCAMVMPYCAVL